MTVPPVSLSHKVGGVLGRKSNCKWTQLEIPATRFSCVTSGSVRPKLGLCILSLVLSVGLCLILVPFLVENPKMAAETPLANEVAVKAVSKANQDFNAKLYPLLVKSKGQTDNLVVSPFSVSSVLAMVLAGANGKTAAEIRQGLALPEDDKVLEEGFESLFSAIKSGENFTLDAANKLYVEQTYKLLEEFLKATAAHFKAEAENVDFKNNAEAARSSINQWVESKTNQKIKELIPVGMIDGLTRLVLVNAVYFKGEWLDKFDEKRTTNSTFYITPEDKVEVPLMRRSGQYKAMFNKDLKATVLEMPYKGKRISFFVCLPHKPEEFAEVEAKWAEFDLLNLELAREAKFDVALPRFRLETSHALDDALKSMGMQSMYADADFSKMSDSVEGLTVSKVLQKAFIEVNEEGAEAAAATGAIMMTRAMIRTPEVICNRPFLFAIKDNLTGMTLFSGRVMDPTKQ